MARNPTLVSALAAGLVLAASPLASATGPGHGELPAQSANMLPLSMCGEREQMVQDLEHQFSETPMAVGQVDGQAIVEILVSETGSWTILATGTDGRSCIVSAGEGFESTTLVRGLDV